MQGAINREIMGDLGMMRAYESAGVAPAFDGTPDECRYGQTVYGCYEHEVESLEEGDEDEGDEDA